MLFQTINVTKLKESLRNSLDLKEMRETGKLDVTGYPELDPGTEKSINVKTGKIRIKSIAKITVLYPC